MDDLMQVHTQYTAHLLRTRHQGEYYKYILDNLQAGEAVVVVDYKMKLELGVRKREIQRDWYGLFGAAHFFGLSVTWTKGIVDSKHKL